MENGKTCGGDDQARSVLILLWKLCETKKLEGEKEEEKKRRRRRRRRRRSNMFIKLLLNLSLFKECPFFY